MDNEGKLMENEGKLMENEGQLMENEGKLMEHEGKLIANQKNKKNLKQIITHWLISWTQFEIVIRCTVLCAFFSHASHPSRGRKPGASQPESPRGFEGGREPQIQTQGHASNEQHMSSVWAAYEQSMNLEDTHGYTDTHTQMAMSRMSGRGQAKHKVLELALKPARSVAAIAACIIAPLLSY